MEILSTERLTLHHMELSDLDSLFELYRDPEVRKYYPDGTRTLAETRDELEWFMKGHPLRAATAQIPSVHATSMVDHWMRIAEESPRVRGIADRVGRD